MVVSTEDEEIATIAQREGAEVDKRPEHMAGDRVTKVQVVQEYLERKGSDRFTNVAALLPTCPFRSVDDVRNAMELFLAHPDKEFLIGVVEYDFPVQLALEKTSDDVVHMLSPENYQTTRSQNNAKRYHPNGAIYLATVEGFKRQGTFFHPEMLAYEMPALRSFDIDYPYQFQLAEIIAQKFLNEHE